MFFLHGFRHLRPVKIGVTLKNRPRSSFITRHDARNIVRRFENVIKHRHHNDAVSVDRLVSELRKGEDNPVIAYKSQV